jgi:hypothetical protein
MADRPDPGSATRAADEGFLRRWSRRKAEARSSAPAPTEAPGDSPALAPASLEPAPESETAVPAPIDPEDLPDIESLDASSDFTVFMRPGVPEHLRTLALRKLWRSDPIFSTLDGLVEYGEDYGIETWPKGVIKTAYQIGRGFVNEIEKLGAAGDRPAAQDEPASEPAPETGPAVASAEPESSTDRPAKPLAYESSASDRAQPPSPAPDAPEGRQRRPRRDAAERRSDAASEGS